MGELEGASLPFLSLPYHVAQVGGELVVFALDGRLQHPTQHLGVHHRDGHGVGSPTLVAHALGIEQFLVDVCGPINARFL